MANITFQEIIAKAKERHEKFIANMSDQNALMYYKLFPEWNDGVTYVAGNRVRYNDMLYRVLVDHVSEIGMEPGECDKFEQVIA